MKIHIVSSGETIESIANKYNVLPNRIIIDNELTSPDSLAIGQALVILFPDIIHIVEPGDTLFIISATYGVDPMEILRNNPIIAESDFLIPGQELVITYKDERIDGSEKIGSIEINGYAYPFIDPIVLRKTLPFLTYLSIFTYGFTPDGELVTINDEPLLEAAHAYGVAPIMVLAPMSEDESFSNELAHAMLSNPEAQDNLIENILDNLRAKNYSGLDIDFEFILPEDKESFIEFITKTSTRLREEGFMTTIALAPKTYANQPGLLYEAHDYPAIGAVVDRALLMTYEWGYSRGFPMAVSPIDKMKEVLAYGISAIEPSKIMMGLPNYGYDWPLPFISGETIAENIGNVQALERAIEKNVPIEFDLISQTPFYQYTTDNNIEHIVWFDDARSMDAKLRLIPEFNLKGTGYWQIMRYFPQNWMVVNSLFDIIKKS